MKSLRSLPFRLVVSVCVIPCAGLSLSCDQAALSELLPGLVTTSGTLTLRVENATASFTVIELTSGLPAATDGTISSDADTSIRVAPGSATNGTLVCGSSQARTGFLVAAKVEREGVTETVLLNGQGSGTPGFGDGSVGISGERFLERGVDYSCGQTIVIRITGDGTRTGSGATDTPEGTIERYAAGEAIPNRSLVPTGTETDTTSNEVGLRIANQTAYFMRINLTSPSASGENINIHVPPGFTTNGAAVCHTQLTLTVTTISGLESAHVVLVGAGTGLPGFDEGSIGEIGDRTFVRGEHFDCGDTIAVTITDPGEPKTNISDAIVGAGVVTITSP